MFKADLRESSQPRGHPENRDHDAGLGKGCEAARRRGGLELADIGTAVFNEECLRGLVDRECSCMMANLRILESM